MLLSGEATPAAAKSATTASRADFFSEAVEVNLEWRREGEEEERKGRESVCEKEGKTITQQNK